MSYCTPTKYDGRTVLFAVAELLVSHASVPLHAVQVARNR